MRMLSRAGLIAGLVLSLLTTPVATSPAHATVVPEHAIVICQSASFYANYDSASGPYNLLRVLYYGDKIGHTRGVHPVYNGWAATFDFGPNDWGYVRLECIGGYGSW